MSMDCWATSSYEYPSGTGICMYGNTSNLQYGTITSYNLTKSDGTYTIKDTVKAVYTMDNGDSGGPVFISDGNYGGQTRVTLIGTNRGVGVDLFGNAYSVFSKYSNIANELGITALTN